MGFKYRSTIGELIFVLMTARPDICCQVINLCQYNNNPAKKYHEAIKVLVAYLWDTKGQGIYYWRKEPNMLLQKRKMPKVRDDSYKPTRPEEFSDPTQEFTYEDSDWVGDTKHRKSSIAVTMMMAGAVII